MIKRLFQFVPTRILATALIGLTGLPMGCPQSTAADHQTNAATPASQSSAVVAETAMPTAATWRSPSRLHRISLNALYPSGSSNIRPIAQAISPNSEVLAILSTQSDRSQSDGAPPERSALALWNLESGTRRITLMPANRGEPGAQVIAFTPNNERIVAGLTDGDIRVWDATTGKSLRRWNAHESEITAIAISSNRQFLVTGSRDRVVKVWELSSGNLLQTLSLGEAESSPVRGLQISANSSRLAVATERSIQLWDSLNAQRVKVAVQFSPQQAQHLTSGIQLAMTFSPDSTQLATLDTDNSIKLWNASSGARIITLRISLDQPEQPIQALAFHPNGQRLLSRDVNQSMLDWNLQPYGPGNYAVDLDAILQPHSTDVVSIDGNRIDSANAIATPNPITFSADGQMVAIPLKGLSYPTSGYGTDLRDVPSGERSFIIPEARQIHFSPNNLFLVATETSQVQIWQP